MLVVFFFDSRIMLFVVEVGEVCLNLLLLLESLHEVALVEIVRGLYELFVRSQLVIQVRTECVFVFVTQTEVVLHVLFSCGSFLCLLVGTLLVLLGFVLAHLRLHEVTELLFTFLFEKCVVLLGRALRNKKERLDESIKTMSLNLPG